MTRRTALSRAGVARTCRLVVIARARARTPPPGWARPRPRTAIDASGRTLELRVSFETICDELGAAAAIDEVRRSWRRSVQQTPRTRSLVATRHESAGASMRRRWIAPCGCDRRRSRPPPSARRGTSTSAPRTSPARSFASASFASSSGNVSTSVRTGISAASARNSSPSRRVRFATERSDALAPQQLVRERRDVRHVDPRADDGAALRDRRERRRDELAGRGEDDRRVELLGRRGPRPPIPRRASGRTPAPRASPSRVTAKTRRPCASATCVTMCAAAPKPYSPSRSASPASRERAVADQPRAEQRRRLQVAEPLGDREAEALVGDDPLGVAAVEVVAREARAVAEVLAAARAEAALAARPAEPRHAEPPAVAGLADDLVARHERQLRSRELAVDHVQVGAADAAGADAEKHLARGGLGALELGRPQPRAGRLEHHRPHGERSTTILTPGLPDAWCSQASAIRSSSYVSMSKLTRPSRAFVQSSR